MHPHQVPIVDVSAVSDDALVLDVREDEEWDAGHIAGARHVPMFQLPQHVAHSEELTRETPIVVVCKMGGRSAQVTAWLTQQGFDAANLDGGMLAWAASGKPMVSEDGQEPRVA